MPYSVTFQPLNKTITIPEGTLISDAAVMAEIATLHLPCGARGTCGKCAVQVKKTSDPDALKRQVLACTTRIYADITVWIEARTASEGCIVANAEQEEQLFKNAPLSPLCRKILIRTPKPGIEDNYADFELLEKEIIRQTSATAIRCSREVLISIGRSVREQDGLVTVTIAGDEERAEVIAIDAGDTFANQYGIACDLGTTTVSVRLLDMTIGHPIAWASDYNGQLSRGADVISRIEYGRTPARLEELRSLALGTINKLVEKTCGDAGRSPRDISCMTIAGNSTMTHLALGLDPRWLREHPYVPTVKRLPVLSAQECGLCINPSGAILFSPLVGSYVGGDITAGLLCTGMIRESNALTLFIDIGTNGEIVIGADEFLLTAACSAGPAFEGSGIRCGMRAATGAIDSFTIEDGGATVDWSVIGDAKPAGICGSGLISLLGELLKAGCIDRTGKFTDTIPPGRRITGDGAATMLLVPAKETANGRDIAVSEADLDNLIRTKAAIYAACDLMLSNAGLSFADVQKVLIAGGFGRFIDLDDAIRIGLLPDLDRSKFSYLGNTSLAGATLALLSETRRNELHALPGKMTYVELSNDPRYMEAYVAALFLPHTDVKRFGVTPA
jgi:uncharacterized 2Fe-2S/4Fe-4S cluster protein (DUF4445 family)